MTYPTQREQEINQVPLSIEFSKDPIENQETLSLMYKRLAQTLNTKTSGLFSLSEQINAEQLGIEQPTNSVQKFQNIYRKTFNLVFLNGGDIAASGTVTYPHGIVGLLHAKLIYASCTSTTPQYFTTVYPNAYLTDTNLIFTNPVGTPLSYCIFVAEYLKT